jgi:hypothetical protein
MKSLSDVAASYDERALANEATAEQILACLDAFAAELQESQRWRAGWLTADAAELRARAAELRQVERCRSIGCVDSKAVAEESECATDCC